MDLADPSWKGRWAASPSGADFQAIVAAMLSLKGEAATGDWLKAEKDNSVAYRGNTAAMKGVNAGEVPGAVIYHYYYFGDKAKTGENSANVALHFFKGQDPGAFVSVSGGAVLKSSKHKDAAVAFLKWIAGKGGQDGAEDRHVLRIRHRQWRRVQPGAAAAGVARSAGGRSVEPQQPEGHRPDDGRRADLIPATIMPRRKRPSGGAISGAMRAAEMPGKSVSFEC